MTTAWGNFGNWLSSDQGVFFWVLLAVTILVMLYNIVVLLSSHDRKRIYWHLVSFFVFGVPWLIFVVVLSVASR